MDTDEGMMMLWISVEDWIGIGLDWILELLHKEVFDKFDWVLHFEISQSLMIIG